MTDSPSPDTARPVDPDLALCASWMRGEEQKERDARKSARDARKVADEQSQLVKAKEAAAAEVKRLRGSDRATAAERAAADDAYKAALAAVVAAETGEAPTWAPAPAPEVETQGEPEGTEAVPTDDAAPAAEAAAAVEADAAAQAPGEGGAPTPDVGAPDGTEGVSTADTEG